MLNILIGNWNKQTNTELNQMLNVLIGNWNKHVKRTSTELIELLNGAIRFWENRLSPRLDWKFCTLNNLRDWNSQHKFYKTPGLELFKRKIDRLLAYLYGLDPICSMSNTKRAWGMFGFILGVLIFICLSQKLISILKLLFDFTFPQFLVWLEKWIGFFTFHQCSANGNSLESWISFNLWGTQITSLLT